MQIPTGFVVARMERQRNPGKLSRHHPAFRKLHAGYLACHADAYIAEREEKRLKGIDIPQHRHYRQGDEGQAAYAGTRQVGGQSLSLIHI